MSDPVIYDFDLEFQNNIAAHVVLDDKFMKRASGLIKPEHFESVGNQILTSIALELFQKYKTLPQYSIVAKEVVDRVKTGVIREELRDIVVEAMKELKAVDITTSRGYVEDEVLQFIRNQEMEVAVLKAAEFVDRGKHDDAAAVVGAAAKIGFTESAQAYDFFGEIEERTEHREGVLSGIIAPTGMSTGIARLDAKLMHKGWGRKELTMIAGKEKSGKSTALAEFAKTACFDGHNVLFVTLEVSKEVTAARFDANMSNTEVLKLGEKGNIPIVEKQIAAARTKCGRLIIHEYPTGTLSVSQLERVLENHASNGLRFDMVVVDYVDLMAPDRYFKDDTIAEGTSIVVGLRRLASQFNCAMLTATQVNRAGAAAVVATTSHVANNIEKARIADLFITINKTDEEKLKSEARLYFAASRNQADGFSLKVKQDLSRMKFIDTVVGIIEGGA